MKARPTPLLAALWLGIALLLGGCSYKVPLTETADVPINNDLLGSWDMTIHAEDIFEEETPFTMVVFKLSATEYIINFYGLKDATPCLRAYPVELDGVRYLQLQELDHRIEANNSEPYCVAKIALNEGELTLSCLTLQKKIITERPQKFQSPSGGYDTSEELRQALQAHRDNPELFLLIATGTRSEK